MKIMSKISENDTLFIYSKSSSRISYGSALIYFFKRIIFNASININKKKKIYF